MYMKKTIIYVSCILVFVFQLCQQAHADYTKKWHFVAGESYVNSLIVLTDFYKTNLEAEGYIVDPGPVLPIGITFNAYYQLDNGTKIGAGIGPVMMILFGGSNITRGYFSIPVYVGINRSFAQTANVSPYFRAGICYNLVSGDYVKDSTPGVFGAYGIEFLRHKRVSFGIEMLVDSSEITLVKYATSYWYTRQSKTETMKSIGFLFTGFVAF
jgi:hypothetical protein